MSLFSFRIPRVFGGLALAAALLAAAPVQAQPTGISVQPLLKTGVSDAPGKEAHLLAIVFAPGASTGRHFHEGDEYASVLEGELELRVEGQPPRRVGAGAAYHNPKGIVHETRNLGTVPARTSAVIVIDRDRPLTTPVP